MRAGARVGADGAGRQRGDDAALDRAVLARDGRGHADKALAALGEISAHRKVELAARAGDVLDAGGLGVDLTEEVAVDGVVDGDEVVDLGDDKHVVRIVDRRTHDIGIAIHVVIELLRAGGEGKDLTALVELLVLAGDLAGEGHVDKAVDVHLGVNGQVLEVRLGDHRADGGGHAADAELEARAIRDLRHDKVGDCGVDLGGGAARAELRNRRILPFHNHVDVLDVDLAAVEAVDPGKVLVDLDDDSLGGIQHVG